MTPPQDSVSDVERLTRPIVGMENRTPQEVFDILCDRMRHYFAALAVPINKIGEDARTYADGVEDAAKVAETAVTYVVGEKRDLCDSIATAVRRLSTSTDKGVTHVAE